MKKNWEKWAHSLQQSRLSEPVLIIMESLGPLSEFLAQILHFGKPLMGGITGDDQWDAITSLLEEPEERDLFIKTVREEKI